MNRPSPEFIGTLGGAFSVVFLAAGCFGFQSEGLVGQRSLSDTAPAATPNGPRIIYRVLDASGGPDPIWIPELEVTTFAGTSSPGYTDGATDVAQFDAPQGITADASGNVYVSDTGNHAIRKITPDGSVTTISGGWRGFDDGASPSAQFDAPMGLQEDGYGGMVIADAGNNRIRYFPGFNVWTNAGGKLGYVDGPWPNDTAWFHPRGIVRLPDNTWRVSDFGNHVIRRSAGTYLEAGVPQQPGYIDGPRLEAKFSGPAGMAYDGSWGILYIADQFNHAIRWYQETGGWVATLAGSGTYGDDDGATSSARFDEPRDIALIDDHNLLVTDTNNHSIRWVGSGGMVVTAAGSGYQGLLDGASSSARFSSPTAITRFGNDFLVCDTGNHVIRRLRRVNP